MYHEIYKPEEIQRLKGVTNPAYNLQFKTFEGQISWFVDNKMKTLTIEDLDYGKEIYDGQAVCITFDDGWKGNYLHVYPLLLSRGCLATFFVAAGLIGKANYMAWGQLRQMRSSGMSIQSHALTHRPLTAMNEKEIIFELQESKDVIETELSTCVTHLSLPHGEKDPRIWDLAKEIGYHGICTSDVGFFTPGSRGPWFKRISVGDSMSASRFRRIALGEGKALWKISAVKWVKDAIKKTIGLRNYRYLYSRLYGTR